MKALTFELELLLPLLATAFGGDPNTDVSALYISGGALRGTLIRLYLQRENKRELDAANDTERKLFLSETVRYLNAYPLIQIETEKLPKKFHTLPVPLSWHAAKDIKEPQEEGDEDVAVADLCHTTAEDIFGTKTQSKALRSPFFYFNRDGNLVAVNPKRRMAIHTQRDPRKGRATVDDGQVFRYESIARGERFGGVILFADDAEPSLLTAIKNLLQQAGELSLGGSRTGGYGRVEVSAITEKEAWRELLTEKPEAVRLDDTFTLTLLSNALVRDANGHLQAALLLPETLRNKVAICEQHSFKAAETIGGFNRKWGLPLAQAVALRAGSVFTLQAKAKIEADELKTLVNDGLGERRGEGFGRVAVNLNQSDTLTWVAPEKDNPTAQPLSNAAQTAAQAMLKRIMCARLDEQLAALINERKVTNAPPNSQIARLRAVVRQAIQTKDNGPIERCLERAKSTARRHYEKARVTKENLGLIDWVRGLSGLEKDEKRKTYADNLLKTLFDIPRTAPVSLGKNAGAVQITKDDFLFAYRLQLIDGVLARAAKEARD